MSDAVRFRLGNTTLWQFWSQKATFQFYGDPQRHFSVTLLFICKILLCVFIVVAVCLPASGTLVSLWAGSCSDRREGWRPQSQTMMKITRSRFRRSDRDLKEALPVNAAHDGQRQDWFIIISQPVDSFPVASLFSYWLAVAKLTA